VERTRYDLLGILEALMIPLIHNLRAAAIDLDGTLIDSVHDIAGAIGALLEGRGLRRMSVDRVSEFVGDGAQALVERVLIETGQAAGPAELKQAFAEFGELYGNTLFTRSRIYPGVLEGLVALRHEGLQLACVTNKAAEFTHPLLQAAGLNHFFDAVFCAASSQQRKPGPWLLHQACDTFRVRPAQLLMVGDSRSDVRAARAAGCFIAAVNYGYNHGQGIENERPDWIIGSLEEIPTLTLQHLEPVRASSRLEAGSC